jgi:hypothetical protein
LQNRWLIVGQCCEIGSHNFVDEAIETFICIRIKVDCAYRGKVDFVRRCASFSISYFS